MTPAPATTLATPPPDNPLAAELRRRFIAEASDSLAYLEERAMMYAVAVRVLRGPDGDGSDRNRVTAAPDDASLAAPEMGTLLTAAICCGDLLAGWAAFGASSEFGLAAILPDPNAAPHRWLLWRTALHTHERIVALRQPVWQVPDGLAVLMREAALAFAAGEEARQQKEAV